MIKSNKKTVDKLILFDHDGTVCETNPLAYDSIKSSFITTLKCFKIDENLEVDWNKIFAETTGTTEKYFVQFACYLYRVPIELIPDFENKYYKFRANWFQTMRESGEYVWDTYFPDAHELLYSQRNKTNVHSWLLTGNPEIVVKERITNSLKEIFTEKNGSLKGVFGNEALSRKDMLVKATEKASQLFGKQILSKNLSGFYKNIFYVADSRNDFFAGLEANIKTIWIPSRKLQDVLSIKSQDYVRFIAKLLTNDILITNDLSSKEVYDYLFNS